MTTTTEATKFDLANFTFHSLADTFPLMGPEELKDLTEDIRKNGLRERITYFEGKILDGRNRYLGPRRRG